MRIGVNCLNLNASFVGGLNSFTLGLLEGFACSANGHQFRLYATEGNQRLFESLSNRKGFEIVVLRDRTFSTRKSLCRAALLSFNERIYEFVSNQLFRGIRKLMEDDSDLIYTPSVVLQSFDGKKPTLLSMHDIQHVHYPEFFNWTRRLSRRITYGLSARHACFFQASSEFIKRDLLQHFECITPEQVVVIHEGVHVEQFATPIDTSALFARYDIPDRFLLFPGQLWPHKNHMTLLRALKEVEASSALRIPLVLTGGAYTALPEVRKYLFDQSMNYVHYLGKVPLVDLIGLYQKAACLVMPSLHESNSLPILEAAAAGTPVIASRIPPNEELDRVFRLNLFDALNHRALAELLVNLWSDEPTGRAQAEHNRRQVQCYSWENASRKYLNLFESMLNA
jgi:glycosyltransferase involved in cell wall biosynthesis